MFGNTSNLLDRSRKSLVAGDNQTALELALKAAGSSPKNAQAWACCGNAHEQMDNFDKAIECYEQAMELDPSDEIGQRLRMCVKYRYKAGGKKDEGFITEFTPRERAVYDKFLAGHWSRLVLMTLTPSAKKNDVQETSAYFGGSPYAEANDRWPECPGRQHSQSFVCQLRWHPNFNDPEKELDEKSSWLVSVFRSFCHCDDESEEKNRTDTVVRIYEQPSAGKARPISATKPTFLPPLDRCDLTVNGTSNFLSDQEYPAFVPESYTRLLDESRPDWPDSDVVILGGLSNTDKDGCTQLKVGTLRFPQGFKIWCCPKHVNEFSVK